MCVCVWCQGLVWVVGNATSLQNNIDARARCEMVSFQARGLRTSTTRPAWICSDLYIVLSVLPLLILGLCPQFLIWQTKALGFPSCYELQERRQEKNPFRQNCRGEASPSMLNTVKRESHFSVADVVLFRFSIRREGAFLYATSCHGDAGCRN